MIRVKGLRPWFWNSRGLPRDVSTPDHWLPKPSLLQVTYDFH